MFCIYEAHVDLESQEELLKTCIEENITFFKKSIYV